MRSLSRQDLMKGSHSESSSCVTVHAVSTARDSQLVYTTSNSMPWRFNNLPTVTVTVTVTVSEWQTVAAITRTTQRSKDDAYAYANQ